MARDADTIRMQGDLLRCIHCERLTTRVESEDRMFNQDSCGHCGGMLVAHLQCAKKLRVRGKTFLCIAERCHRGPHRFDVTVEQEQT